MIHLSQVSVTYNVPVLAELNFHVPPGGHAALMGPSGCGKSTVLNLVAGLQKPTSGTVTVATGTIGYVFQEPRLIPWLTAAQNVNAVLSDRKDTMEKARYWLAQVGLTEAADKLPRELSGGMQQRVNLARALASEPDILLLDEPLKGLDEAMQQQMLSLLVQCTKGKTLVLATHSPAEAAVLCDRVYRYENHRFV
jgi:NitT/TauT family transport system ATP-binding protein